MTQNVRMVVCGFAIETEETTFRQTGLHVSHMKDGRSIKALARDQHFT
jgi:hypothetical protein